MKIQTGGALSACVVTDSADWPEDDWGAVNCIHEMRVYLADLEAQEPAWYARARAILDAGTPLKRANAEADRIAFAVQETAPEGQRWGLFHPVPSCSRCTGVRCSCD